MTVGNGLINMYGKCGELNGSMKVLQCLMIKNDVSWSSIIGILVHAGLSRNALGMLKDLIFSEIKPNATTMASLLP